MAKRLIFIVDDEPAITEPLAYALTTDGFQVESFTLGQACQQRLNEQIPDLLVLDVGLPDINGFELFRTIKAQADLPILFLTARGEEIDRVVGLELGADDYVVKPFSPREVAARIRVIIKRYNTGVSDTKREQSLTVNQQTATAVYFGTTLSLTRFEFLILAQLAESPEHVFSRAQLIDTLWPDRSGSMERSVDTHIKTLRSKLKHIRADVDVIKTHRGLGYSLELP
ncbi:MAG: two-component system response regulator CreB [Reinekea sp.]|jgi:two-component system, OmpR family, catabolic regulation response regulator CreB